jgi:hypothetical protein
VAAEQLRNAIDRCSPGDVAAERTGVPLGTGLLDDLGEHRVELGHVPDEIGGEREPAAGLEDAAALGGGRVGVGEIVEGEIGDDQVEARIRIGHARRIALLEGDMADTPRLGLGARSCHSGRPGIESVDDRGRSETLGELDGGEAGATADIERHHAGTQRYVIEQELARQRRPHRKVVIGGDDCRVIQIDRGRQISRHVSRR